MSKLHNSLLAFSAEVKARPRSSHGRVSDFVHVDVSVGVSAGLSVGLSVGEKGAKGGGCQ